MCHAIFAWSSKLFYRNQQQCISVQVPHVNSLSHGTSEHQSGSCPLAGWSSVESFSVDVESVSNERPVRHCTKCRLVATCALSHILVAVNLILAQSACLAHVLLVARSKGILCHLQNACIHLRMDMPALVLSQSVIVLLHFAVGSRKVSHVGCTLALALHLTTASPWNSISKPPPEPVQHIHLACLLMPTAT